MNFHSGNITKEQNDGNHILVYGSNLAGRHGAGAALFAQKYWGAEYGIGVGRTGNAYGIPTKDQNIRTLSLDDIQFYVSQFKLFTYTNPDLTFLITRIGCGLAGYKDEQVAPMFINLELAKNVLFPPEWKDVLYQAIKEKHLKLAAKFL